MSTQINGADPLLIRANKLDLLERVADDLAHEIKNPLHSMVINLEVLKRRISRAGADGATDLLRYVEVLGSELDRVSHRVDLLLRMMRPARSAESTPLREILDEMRELMEMEGARRSVDVRFGFEAPGLHLSVPRELARQVILNLVLGVLDTLAPGDALQVVLGRAREEVFLRVTGVPAAEATASPAEGEPPTASGDHPPPRPSFVAEALSSALGGRVEADSAGTGFTLALPDPTP
jgi:nitrogen-specific signal transduction histidine kinase